MKTFLIFLVSLTPFLTSLLLLRKAKQRWQIDLRRARNQAQQLYHYQNHQDRVIFSPFIGDVSCEYNARSPYLRCAVNPDGPCQDCSYYQAKYKD